MVVDRCLLNAYIVLLVALVTAVAGRGVVEGMEHFVDEGYRPWLDVLGQWLLAVVVVDVVLVIICTAVMLWTIYRCPMIKTK